MFNWNDSFSELEQIRMKYNRLLNIYQKNLPLANYGLMYNSLIPATLKMYQPSLFRQIPSFGLTPSYLSAIQATLPITKTYSPFAEKYFPIAKIAQVPNGFMSAFSHSDINRMMQATEAVAKLIPKAASPSILQSPAFVEMQNIRNRLSPIFESYGRIASFDPFQNRAFTIDIGDDRANEISSLIESSMPNTFEEKPTILQSISNKMTPAAILALACLLLESANLVLIVRGINCPQLAEFKEIIDWLTGALEFYDALNKKSSNVKKVNDGTGRLNQERKG